MDSKKNTVLITGGAGFIGSNIVDELIKRNMRAVIIDNLSTGSKDNINKDAQFYKCDLRDKKKLEEVFAKERPNYIIHTAAQISVSKSVREPEEDADINIIGILNLLRMTKKYNSEKIVFSSSGGVMYGEETKIFPTPETVCPNPISPYGIAKLACEKYIAFYGNEKSLKYTILRYANVYGPRQNSKGEAGVIAIFAEKMLKGKKVTINGDGEYIRDYIFVKDVVDANIRAIETAEGEIINIGTETGTTVNQVFEILKNITGYKQDPSYGPARPGDLRKSIISNKKAKDLLGWDTKYSFKDGIKKTVTYYKEKQ